MILFVVDAITILNKNCFASSYLAESFDLWHGRLMKKMNIIPSLSLNASIPKCYVSIEANFVKKPFPSVLYGDTVLLELIHYDLAMFMDLESKGGK